MNREQWLTKAAKKLEPIFRSAGFPLRHDYRVTCSWPSVGGTRAKKPVFGQCWHEQTSVRKIREIFITPRLDKPEDVLEVLVHELVHAAVGNDCGHRGPFKTCATAIGLEGKMSATTVGIALANELRVIAEKLGPYPHGALQGEDPTKKKQGTRLIRVECGECGYLVRTTEKWLAVAVPTCPNYDCSSRGEEMTV